MSESFADLIEKLCILHVKLYHVQEIVDDAAEEGCGLGPEVVAKLNLLNHQRGPLKSEINEVAGVSDNPDVKVT